MGWGVHRRSTREGLDTMAMTLQDTDTGIESQLLDLTEIPFARLRELDSLAVRQALHHVISHAEGVRAITRSTNASGGERID